MKLTLYQPPIHYNTHIVGHYNGFCINPVCNDAGVHILKSLKLIYDKMQPLRKPLLDLASVATSRFARICITPGGEPHVKVVQNGHVVDKILIDIKDRANTYKALCALKDRILNR